MALYTYDLVSVQPGREGSWHGTAEAGSVLEAVRQIGHRLVSEPAGQAFFGGHATLCVAPQGEEKDYPRLTVAEWRALFARNLTRCSWPKDESASG